MFWPQRLDALKKSDWHSGFRAGFAIGLGVLLLVLGGALGFRAGLEGRSGHSATVAANTTSNVDLRRGFSSVAAQVEPAVVNINTEQVIHNAGATHDPLHEFFGEQDPFGFFFKEIPHDMKQKSLGSGFVVDPSGYILTNNHVVENASRIRVKFDDGRMMEASVVGTDPQTDLAVLRVKASGLPVLHLAHTDQVEVGDWVLAFGSPFGLEKTMTAGIISAKGRVVGAGPYDNFLQTDAAINPGNSGGPLVNLSGNVVGINTMIASQSGGFQGVGFAIPAPMAQDVYTQIVSSGKVTRGWLGIHIQEITPEIAKSFNLGGQKGVLVADVDPNGPAARGGLQSGDILLAYGGQQLHSAHDLMMAVAGTRVGSSSKLEVLHNGEHRSIVVTVGERPADLAEAFESSKTEERGRLGITAENVTSEAQHQMNLGSRQGALVTEVRPGSPADDGGVQPGDVIHELNHVPVSQAADLHALARNLKKGSTVLLKIERQRQTFFLAFDLSS